MSLANFDPSLVLVLQHEGGFVNHPKDPGGATNKGVTQAVYDDWRASKGLPLRSVKYITMAEVGPIYRKLYWDACRCDDLPSGVDYCVFDFAVNSGRDRAARYLQRCLGVIEDGHIGPMTLAAAKAKPAQDLIQGISDLRLEFLKHLKIYDTFGRGWARRVAEVEAKAREMAA